MLDDILTDSGFSTIMTRHAKECLGYLIDKNEDFCILANIPFVSFAPPLPAEISNDFRSPAIMFVLAGYTLGSAVLGDGGICFEAGFGESNYESVVSVPYSAVIQIIIGDSPVFINFSHPELPSKSQPSPDKQSEREASKKAFLNNPKNRDFFSN